MNILKKVGKFCRECRESAGITQKAISNDVECTPQNITQFEKGNSNSLKIFLWYMINTDFDTNKFVERIDE